MSVIGPRPQLVRDMVFMNEEQRMARLANGTVTFYNLDGDEIEKKPTQIKWDAEAAEKAGYEHFMLKEIHEQPKAVQDTLNSVLKDGAIDLSSVGLTEEELQSFSQIYIVAWVCGRIRAGCRGCCRLACAGRWWCV